MLLELGRFLLFQEERTKEGFNRNCLDSLQLAWLVVSWLSWGSLRVKVASLELMVDPKRRAGPSKHGRHTKTKGGWSVGAKLLPLTVRVRQRLKGGLDYKRNEEGKKGNNKQKEWSERGVVNGKRVK